jgi:hypothetical protein
MKLLHEPLLVIFLLTLQTKSCWVHAFTTTRVSTPPMVSTLRPFTIVSAGGFEWEDPTEAFDQGVENPYKKSSLMEGEGGLKIDPARLLSPRMNGANLYLVGMMGSGKSAVGKIVAKRKLLMEEAPRFSLLHSSVLTPLLQPHVVP